MKYRVNEVPLTPPLRRTESKRLTAKVISLVGALGLSAYVAACAFVPLPEPTVTFELPSVVDLPSDAAIARAVADQVYPTAAGWAGADANTVTDAIWSNDDTAYPLASLSKLVTALVGLEQEPLEPGEEGEVHVWDEWDVELQAELLALDGVAFPIPEGTEVSRLQMLTLALVPSANDFAMSYAYSVFGDNDGFVQAVDAWKERHGLESLHLDEPSGMSEANVASPADLVRISQLALANPVVANIVAAEYAELPWGLGEVPNTNPLFGLMPGVVGLKTGFTEEAGYNLAAAAQTHIEGRDFTGIAVVFSRDSLDSSAEDAMTLLATLLDSPHTVTLVESGERVGMLRTVDRQVSGLIADERASAVVAPGEVPSFTSELSVGGSSGSLIVETPGHTIHVPIHLERTPQPPSFWWRITHPLTLFGIGAGSPVT